MAAFIRMHAMLRTVKAPSLLRRKSQLGTFMVESARTMNLCSVATGRTSDANEEGSGRHRLIAAVSVERKPVVSSDPSLIEREFRKILQKIEFEKSLLSDHELRHLEDLRRKERFASGTATEADLEAPPQTAQDFEDLVAETLHQFRPASRVSEADEQGDRRSLKRQLQRHLLLLIKGSTQTQTASTYSKWFGEWYLPCAEHQKGETLKQTAERAVNEFCGAQLKVTMLGCAPIGFFKYVYPKKYRQDGLIGANVFFFRGNYVGGSIASEATDDHCWVTREEMEIIFEQNFKYLKALKSFTYDERFTYEIRNRFLDKAATRLAEKINN